MLKGAFRHELPGSEIVVEAVINPEKLEVGTNLLVDFMIDIALILIDLFEEVAHFQGMAMMLVNSHVSPRQGCQIQIISEYLFFRVKLLEAFGVELDDIRRPNPFQFVFLLFTHPGGSLLPGGTTASGMKDVHKD